MACLRIGGMILVVLCVVIAALGLRAWAVNQLPIDYDEDDYLLAGQHYARAFLDGNWGEVVNYAYNLEHPPLVKLLYGLALTRLPQVPEVPQRPTSAAPAASLPQPHLYDLRLISALLGTLEVLALALIDPLAGFFLAIHTFTIKYTSQAMLEALPALTSLLAVMTYTCSRKRGGFNAWLALSAACLGLTAAAKYMYAIVGIVIIIHWLWGVREEYPPVESRLTRRWLPLLGWGVISLAVFFLADPFLWVDPLGRIKASILFNVAYSQSSQVQSVRLPFWQPLIWLFQSVPWHQRVFLIAVDSLIAVLALFGLKRLWQRHQVYGVWLLVGVVFLLIWPTKWPQYILLLTAPVSLAASQGVRVVIWEPFVNWLGRLRARKPEEVRVNQTARTRLGRRELKRATPWLLPGIIVLGLIAVSPLIFQAAMALTDFKAAAIRDGLTGGVWREVWLGLTGQVKPVAVEAFERTFSRDRTVHFAGLSLITSMLSGIGVSILTFEIIWTVLSVSLQLIVGLGVALLLARGGLLFRRFWMAIFILPWAIPEFIGALIWARMLEPGFGWLVLMTSFPETPGYPPPGLLSNWQSQPDKALGILLLAAVWWGFPLMMVAATAALKMIPREVYDASALDGASSWGTFRWITWPMVLPLLLPAIIIRMILAFNQFYLFYVLQAPFPMTTFAALSFFVMDPGGPFGGFFALSAAINLLTVGLLIFFLFFFNRWSKATEGVTYA